MDDVIVSESAKYEIIDKILKEEQDNINNNHIISDVDMVDKIVKIIIFDIILNKVIRKITLYSDTNNEITDDYVMNLLISEAFELKNETDFIISATFVMSALLSSFVLGYILNRVGVTIFTRLSVHCADNITAISNS